MLVVFFKMPPKTGGVSPGGVSLGGGVPGWVGPHVRAEFGPFWSNWHSWEPSGTHVGPVWSSWHSWDPFGTHVGPFWDVYLPPWPPSALWSPPPICKKQCLLRSGKGLPKGFGRAPERLPKGSRKVSEKLPKGFRTVPERFPKGPRKIPERFPNVSGPPEAFRVRNKCYKYEVFNIAPFPERFRGSETVREPFGNLSGTVRKTFGNLSGTFRDPRSLSGSLPKPFGNLLGTFP